MIRLLFESIPDDLVKNTFKRVSDFINAQSLLSANFVFQELELVQGTNRLPHLFKNIPRDVIITGVSDYTAEVKFRFEEFSRTFLVVDLGVATRCTVRCFIGTYTGGSDV